MASATNYTRWHKMLETWERFTKFDRSKFNEIEQYVYEFYTQEKHSLHRVARDVPFFIMDWAEDETWSECTDEYARIKDAVGCNPIPFDELVVEKPSGNGYRFITHYMKTLGGAIICNCFLLLHDTNYAIPITLDQDIEKDTGWCLPAIQERFKDIFNDSRWHGQDIFERLIVMLHTKGVLQEKLQEPKFTNREREKKGKPCVPSDVTIIKIGHYYSRDGECHEFDARKPTRIHWRRGHVRRVWCGTSENRHTEERYIAPCLVNYQPGDETPKQQIRIL